MCLARHTGEASVVDDAEFVAAGYEIQLFRTEFPRTDDGFLVDLADSVARKLAANGCEVLRQFDSSRAGKGGVLYHFDRTLESYDYLRFTSQLND
jgi:hypothetical protein